MNTKACRHVEVVNAGSGGGSGTRAPSKCRGVSRGCRFGVAGTASFFARPHPHINSKWGAVAFSGLALSRCWPITLPPSTCASSPARAFFWALPSAASSDEADAHFYMAAILKCAAGVLTASARSASSPSPNARDWICRFGHPDPQPRRSRPALPLMPL